jgi:hypothetical protein
MAGSYGKSFSQLAGKPTGCFAPRTSKGFPWRLSVNRSLIMGNQLPMGRQLPRLSAKVNGNLGDAEFAPAKV